MGFVLSIIVCRLCEWGEEGGGGGEGRFGVGKMVSLKNITDANRFRVMDLINGPPSDRSFLLQSVQTVQIVTLSLA